MKKFTSIDKTFENKKFQEKEKNDIYSLIKENIIVDLKPLNESEKSYVDNVKIDLEGTTELVEKINKYVDSKIKEERIKVLESIKTAIATGTLSIEKINEEINACSCSETCPDEHAYDNDEEDINKDILGVDTSHITNKYGNGYKKHTEEEEFDEEEDTNENLAVKFIEKIETGNAENMTWENFFNELNIPESNRTKEAVDKIYKRVYKKRPDLF